MLPVQIVADNQGQTGLYIVANQTFLQDKKGNLWLYILSWRGQVRPITQVTIERKRLE